MDLVSDLRFLNFAIRLIYQSLAKKLMLVMHSHLHNWLCITHIGPHMQVVHIIGPTKSFFMRQRGACAFATAHATAES